MEEHKESNQLVGEVNLMAMSESKTLEKILAYIAGGKLKVTLEVEVKYMVIEAKRNEAHLEGPDKDFEPEPPDKVQDELQG